MKKIAGIMMLLAGTSMLLSGCGTNAEAKGMPGGERPGGMAASITEGTSVEIATAEKQLIEEAYIFSGTIKPSEEVSVLSALSGVKVESVNFDVGDRVNAGDVLFTLDTENIENNIKVLQASLASAEASIQSAQTNLELANGSSMQTQAEAARNAVSTAEKSLKSAEISLNTAQTDYENGKLLFDVGGITQTELDGYKNSYENAKMSYENAQSALSQAQSSYDILVNQTMVENERKAQDSLNVAKAAKQSTAAQMASYEKQLNDAQVTSPITGTVLECNVTEGAVLSQSTPFVMINLDQVKIEVNISEQMASYVKPGSSVEITVSAISEEPFTGTVATVAPGADSDGTYPVTITVDNSDGMLKSGMFSEVTFIKNSSEDSIVIDRSALLTKSGETYVYINDNGTAKKMSVVTGIDTGDKIQIVSGLEEGMSIVTTGNSYLKDGDALHIVNSLEAERQEDSQQSENTGNEAGAPSGVIAPDGTLKKEE